MSGGESECINPKTHKPLYGEVRLIDVIEAKLMNQIKDYLEIFIITYNRSRFLERTLTALENSPVSQCKITILNNVSTDNTLEICSAFSWPFPSLRVITHKYNIGADANFMRAVEMSDGKYTWVLCDDDKFDFSEIDDVFNAIFSENVSLILVGGSVNRLWTHGGHIDTPRKLIKDGFEFFKVLFIPCNIFKTKDFEPYIIKGYENISNKLAHAPFLFSFFEDDKNIYISKRQIVLQGAEATDGITHAVYMNLWLRTALLLKRKSDRKIFLKENYFDMLNPNKSLKGVSLPIIMGYYLILDKVEKPFALMSYFYGYPVIFLSILLYVPLRVIRALISRYRMLKERIRKGKKYYEV